MPASAAPAHMHNSCSIDTVAIFIKPRLHHEVNTGTAKSAS